MDILVYEDKEVFTKKATKLKPIQYIITEAGCWECISHVKGTDGYTKLTRNGKYVKLMRYVYEQQIGKIPEGLELMHSCDNPACFNPSHLTPGTTQENQADKVRKGRQAKGEANGGGGKLTADQARQIRIATGKQRDIAKAYGVSQHTVCAIKNNKIWSHVK